jgi:hypothetical protein
MGHDPPDLASTHEPLLVEPAETDHAPEDDQPPVVEPAETTPTRGAS